MNSKRSQLYPIDSRENGWPFLNKLLNAKELKSIFIFGMGSDLYLKH